MKLDKQLFDSVAKLAAESPRLRMNYDLRDSEDEDGQRMLNVLLPGTKSAIHRHTDTSEVVMTAGSDCPGLVVEQGRYHSLEANGELGVIMEAKAHKYHPFKTEDILDK